MTTYRRVLLAVLGVALLACAYVAVARFRYEHASKRVEIALDYGDASALARSYGYRLTPFLVALRRAGVTSLAIPEELGANVDSSPGAIALDGQTLIDQARLAPLQEPYLAALARRGAISRDEVYVVVYDGAEYPRYRDQAIIHYGAHAVRILHASLPYVLAIRTQTDFFNGTGLGIPSAQLALARRLHFFLVPRIQNDEAFGPAQIDAIVAAFTPHERVSTAIFFGVRNEVLGYPNNLAATAAALKRAGIDYGSVEFYDASQDQKGNEALGTLLAGRTVRVQAIARPELDKIDPKTVVARYLLGVRERNVRVVYLRPLTHPWNGRSILGSNVELVREIASGLRATGFRLGRASPVPPFRVNPLVVALASLAVPAIFLLILDTFGIADPRLAAALCALDLVVYGAALLVHHDMAARKLIALCGGILFPVAGAIAIGPAFRRPEGGTYGATLVAGLRLLVVAIGTALGGALVVVGLLSTPSTMEEIDRFTGVKAVLVVPPLVVLLLALATRRFGGSGGGLRATFDSPVRLYQLILGVVLVGIGGLVVMRSGNDSDIAPSAIELALRAHLTAILSVRPRFKEFVLAWPLVMLLPALVPRDLRRAGWLIALAAGVGLADVVDTFSHLHTPLGVSALRLFNGVVLGVILGAILVAAYRAALRALASRREPGDGAAAPLAEVRAHPTAAE